MTVERQAPHDLARADAVGRKLGIGCFGAFLGAVSMGMVAVLVGKMWAFLTRAPSCQGVPLCDWHVWAGWGALAGLVTLPILILTRVGRPAAPPANSDRG